MHCGMLHDTSINRSTRVWHKIFSWLCFGDIIRDLDRPHGTISYPLFGDADTGIYPHAASQYYAWPKAKRGIAMLTVDKFPYLRKQTGVTNLSHAQTIFVTFWNVSAALKSQLSHKSGLNHRINTVLLGRTVAVRKADGDRNRYCDVINDVPLS